MKRLLLVILLFTCLNSYAICDMNITKYHIDRRVSSLRDAMEIDRDVFIRIMPLQDGNEFFKSTTFHDGIYDFTIKIGDVTQSEAKRLILVEMSYVKMIHEGRLQRLSPFLFVFEGDTIDCTEMPINKTVFHLESKIMVNQYRYLFKSEKTWAEIIGMSMIIIGLLALVFLSIIKIWSERAT